MSDKNSEIPKIIYQTYSSKKLPLVFETNLEINKKNAPSYEFKLFDDNDIINFIKKEYGKSMLMLYFSINEKYGAVRADFWRYLVIYKYGGIYLDIKSAIIRPLDDLIKSDDHFIYSLKTNWTSNNITHNVNGENISGQPTQWCIIARKGHPFLKKMILLMIKNFIRAPINISNKKDVLKLAGPGIYAKVLNHYRDKPIYKFIEPNTFYKFFSHSLMETRFNVNHKSVFKNHYSKLNEPILIRKFEPIFYQKLVYKFIETSENFKKSI